MRTKPLTVLALTRYGALGASSRVRLGQFVPGLAEAGIAVYAVPLLSDAYIRDLYAGRPRRRWPLAASYARRVWAMRARVDMLWVEKELLPFAPAWAERLLLAGRPYVVDYDDATFHSYDLHPNRLVRRMYGRKVDRLMRAASLVVAGNAYLAERARAAGAQRVEILPSVVDMAAYGATSPAAGRPFTIGWVGSPGSERLLDGVAGVLAESVTAGARLVLVGASERALPGVPHETRLWTKETEAADIAAFDIGIMPLADSPWERGKCGFKLIQYMAAGRPVVASPVGVNAEIVVEGETGFLAGDPAAWRVALARLRADPSLRATMGATGHARAEARYSLAVAGPRFADLLRSALD